MLKKLAIRGAGATLAVTGLLGLSGGLASAASIYNTGPGSYNVMYGSRGNYGQSNGYGNNGYWQSSYGMNNNYGGCNRNNNKGNNFSSNSNASAFALAVASANSSSNSNNRFPNMNNNRYY